MRRAPSFVSNRTALNRLKRDLLNYPGYARIYRNFAIWVADNRLGNGGKGAETGVFSPLAIPDTG